MKSIYILFTTTILFFSLVISSSQAEKVVYPYVPECEDPSVCVYQKIYPNCEWDGDVCDSGHMLAAEFRCTQIPANTSITFEYSVKVPPEPYFSEVSVPNGSGNIDDSFSVIAWRIRDKTNLRHLNANIFKTTADDRKQYMVDVDDFCLNAPDSDGDGGYTNTGCLEISRQEKTSGDTPITYTTGDSEESVHIFIIAEKTYTDMECLSLMQTISIRETP